MGRATDSDVPRTVDPDTGTVRFSADWAEELLLRGRDIAKLYFEAAPEIAAYNGWCEKFDKASYQLQTETPECSSGDLARRLATWHITDPYRELPVRETLLQRCLNEVERERVMMEMDLFEARGLLPLLRLMFMLVDHWRQHDVVWGVGRGSSVASYCLFLIGVHRIDSLAYGLDINEFLRNDEVCIDSSR